jgi:hypothetical protein
MLWNEENPLFAEKLKRPSIKFKSAQRLKVTYFLILRVWKDNPKNTEQLILNQWIWPIKGYLSPTWGQCEVLMTSKRQLTRRTLLLKIRP